MFCVKIVQIQKLQETLDICLFIFFIQNNWYIERQNTQHIQAMGGKSSFQGSVA